MGRDWERVEGRGGVAGGVGGKKRRGGPEI